MKRFLIIGAVVVLVLVIMLGAMQLKIRAERPEILLKKLRAGSGDKDAIKMKLNLARGDTVPGMIEAFLDETAPITFRADILELLFSKHRRTPDETILPALKAALRNSDASIRKVAVTGFDMYGSDDERRELVVCVDDPDPDIRRQVLVSFTARRGWHDDGMGMWNGFTDQQREELLKKCAQRAKTEQDPDLAFLNRAVVGREIASLADKAFQKLQTGDFEGGEKMLQRAIQWDPQNHQARVRLPRYYLKAGMTEKALELAAQNDCLLRIPLLKEVPQIDGDPTDAAWQGAYRHVGQPWYSAVSPYAPKEAMGKSDMYIGHRDGTIYIAVLGYEEDLHQLTVKHKTRDSDVWRDDCVEIFFDPDIDTAGFYQFVINPLGALFDAFNHRKSENFQCQWGAKIFHDRGYWACEFAVPAKSLHDRKLTADAVWGFNLTRTRIGPASDMCAFWPTFGATANRENYPLAVFEGLENIPAEPNTPEPSAP